MDEAAWRLRKGVRITSLFDDRRIPSRRPCHCGAAVLAGGLPKLASTSKGRQKDPFASAPVPVRAYAAHGRDHSLGDTVVSMVRSRRRDHGIV